MDEANCGVPARQERNWKLFVLHPRLLLFKNARGGTFGWDDNGAFATIV